MYIHAIILQVGETYGAVQQCIESGLQGFPYYTNIFEGLNQSGLTHKPSVYPSLNSKVV